MIPDNTFIVGDCLDVLRDMPDNSVDLVWTSPPYNLGNFSKGSFYGGKGKGEKLIYNSHDDNMPEEKYIEWQHNILKQCYRIIKETGAIFYNHKPRVNKGVFDDRKNLIPFPIRQEIIWDRCCMVNFSGGFYAPNTERIFIIAKSSWKPNKEYLGMGEVWRVSPETENDHPAPFPVELSSMVIKSASRIGDIILDPFGGSGTTAIAAYTYERKFILIEKESKYIEIAKRRYAEAVAQGNLFDKPVADPVQEKLL